MDDKQNSGWDGIERRTINTDISHTSMSIPQVAALILGLLSILGSVIGLYVSGSQNQIRVEYKLENVSQRLDEIATTVKAQQKHIMELDQTVSQMYNVRSK